MPEVDVDKIIGLLEKYYPRAETSLQYQTPFQFLVAVILSARSTDIQVNRITGGLFERFPDSERMAEAGEKELSALIKGCGLYRSKSTHLVRLARTLREKHGGKVPATWDEVMALPGVGKKTASLVMGTLWGKPAFPVDTHVYRVSRRLGLTTGETVKTVEEELKRIVREDKWLPLHHRLIAHGRSVCTSRNPDCEKCFLSPYCSKILEGKSKGVSK